MPTGAKSPMNVVVRRGETIMSGMRTCRKRPKRKS